jgi:hypothetical protein
MEAASASLGVETIAMPVQSDSDIEAVMTASAQQPDSGLVVIPDSFTGARRDLIIAWQSACACRPFTQPRISRGAADLWCTP